MVGSIQRRERGGKQVAILVILTRHIIRRIIINIFFFQTRIWMSVPVPFARNVAERWRACWRHSIPNVLKMAQRTAKCGVTLPSYSSVPHGRTHSQPGSI